MNHKKPRLQHLSAKLVCDIIKWAQWRHTEDIAEQFAEDPWDLTKPRPLKIISAADIKPPTPELYAQKQLRALLKSLTEPQLVELTALMWLGRGDSNWKAILAYAEKTSHGPGEVEYVLGKPLDIYLTQALAYIAFPPP